MQQSFNPANGQLICEWPLDAWAQILGSINASEAAFQTWSALTVQERCRLLNNLADELEQAASSLAKLIASTMGKPVTAAHAEITKSALAIRYFARAELLEPKSLTSSYDHAYEVLQPLGVIFTVMPWNYPVWQIVRVLAPNFLLGNAMLLAHAPNVHAVGLYLAKIIANAGLPAALLTPVRPDYIDYQKIIEHPQIKGLAFTGSDKIGAKLAGYAGAALKPATLECGGSDPYLVLADANLEHAANKIVAMRMNNSGQVCVSAKRVIVHAKVYEQFVALCEQLIKEIAFGDPADPATLYGPLARLDIQQKVQQQVQASIAQGANCRLGGCLPNQPGYYYMATLLTEVTPEMTVFKEEVFGPVMAIIKAESDAEAIKLANQHEYGLGAAIFTQNLAYGQELAQQIKSGICMINTGVSSDPALPFGGVGRSGFGRELGLEGLRAFANIKIIGMNNDKS